MFRSFSLLILTIFVEVKAQIGGTLATGDSYVCVPPGYCDNGGTPPPNPGIDPRIVTPGQLCPSGLIPCYAQGPSSRCGERLVSPAPSTADGPAPAGAHPWVVFLTNSTHPVHAGSGVIIDNYHVLTAAHKVAGDVGNPAAVTVRAGVNIPNASPTSQLRTAAAISVHPSYTGFPTLMNDIAIVTVSEPFAFSQNDVNSLCLPTAGPPSMFVGQSCIVAGWGETQFMLYDNPTNPMRQVNVNVIDTATCRAQLLPVIPTVDTYLDQAGELCAGGVVDRDACTFDGGSPLTCPATGKSTMAGLVIWGKGCGTTVPGVYVSTSYYRGWIDTTITQLNNS